MRLRFLLLLVALGLVAFSLAGCVTPTTDPSRLPAGAWSLDPGHASVTWRVRHLGLSWYTGRFDGIEASLDFDPEAPDSARLTAILDAASLSTGDAAFDTTLAQDWFHADRHPQIVFVSDRIEQTGETSGRAYGQLSMNGTTAPATLDITFYGGAFNWLAGRDMIGFGADMIVNRDDFGIGNLPQSIVGQDVHIRIEAEFLRGSDT